MSVAGGATPGVVTLDGDSLTPGDLARLARDPRVRVEVDAAALERVARGWAQIQGIADRYRAAFEASRRGEPMRPAFEYGVTTGFGEFKDIPVPPDELEQLQRNILLSHSVGLGDSSDAADPASYFPAEVVRAALAVRLNAFLKGFSGVRVELVRVVQAMLNRGIVPLVPVRGSVGSSGDLCPLAHLFAVLLGSGTFYRVHHPDDLTISGRELLPADRLAAELGLAVPAPSYKEGLALTNGATFSTALLALAVDEGEALANAADVAAALAFEAVCGCARALDPRVHAARGHAGQIDSAANLRALLAGSRQMERAGAVQDPYTLRCAPQVHGAARDALAYARMVAQAEINAATDNPLFFPGDEGEPWDRQFSANEGYDLEHRLSYSAGNFHGEPVGIAADLAAIALAELANISERRMQMLLDSHHNRNLPGNLTAIGGLNSGLMICQYSAAGVVSENKVLAHPASVDSIPTSANSEDHNAMSTFAARKLRMVLRNAQAVLALELLVAAQAVEWRVAMDVDPRLAGDAATPPAPPHAAVAVLDARTAALLKKKAQKEAAHAAFRDRTAETHRGAIAARLGAGTAGAYLHIRSLVPPVVEDRPLDEDARRLRRALEDRSLVAAVEQALPGPLAAVPALGTASATKIS